MSAESPPADTVGHHHPDTEPTTDEYVLTTSIAHSLHSFQCIGLQKPSPDFVKKIEDGIHAATARAIAGTGYRLVSISFAGLCEELASLAATVRRKNPDARAISTAPLLSYDTGGLCLELNRVIDLQGKILGITGRPGHPPLEVQVQRIATVYAGQRIIIVEDGGFSGETLSRVLVELKKRGVHVIAIVLGILFPKAEREIRAVFDGEIHCSQRLQKPVEWMPTHDFIPFIPNSGRVVGARYGEHLHPIHTPTGGHLCVPYLLPYVSPVGWASIPEKTQNRFSLDCLSLAREIFVELERVNGKQIRFCDLAGSYPGVGYPISVDGKLECFPSPDKRVIEDLDSAAEVLY